MKFAFLKSLNLAVVLMFGLDQKVDDLVKITVFDFQLGKQFFSFYVCQNSSCGRIYL